MDENKKIKFKNIMNAWDNNKSHSEIYQMIYEWITEFSEYIKSKYEVNEILIRMSTEDNLIDIVEDFIYGECYRNIRIEMDYFY
jgi:hypothetical protein